MFGLPLHSFWRGFLGAVVALALGVLVIHAWSDHVALHTLVEFLNQHAAKIATLPPP